MISANITNELNNYNCKLFVGLSAAFCLTCRSKICLGRKTSVQHENISTVLVEIKLNFIIKTTNQLIIKGTHNARYNRLQYTRNIHIQYFNNLYYYKTEMVFVIESLDRLNCKFAQMRLIKSGVIWAYGCFDSPRLNIVAVLDFVYG